MVNWNNLLEKIKEMKQGECMAFETKEGHWNLTKIEDYGEKEQ